MTLRRPLTADVWRSGPAVTSQGWLAQAGDVEHPPDLRRRQHLERARVTLGQPDQGVDRGRVEERDRRAGRGAALPAPSPAAAWTSRRRSPCRPRRSPRTVTRSPAT